MKSIIIFIIIASLHNSSESLKVNENFVAEIYTKYKPVSYVVGVCTCWPKFDITKIVKSLSANRIRSSFPPYNIKPDYNLKVPDSGDIGILINSDCNQSRDILEQASELMLFNRTYKWLVLAEKEIDYTVIFQNLTIYIDAEITLAVQTGNAIDIYDVYGYLARENQSLEANHTGYYNVESGLYIKPLGIKYRVRNNFHKYNLRVGTVITRKYEEIKDNYVDLLRTRIPVKGIVGLTKYHHDLICLTRDMFNYTIDYRVDEAWAGELPNGTRVGVVGMLSRREIDIIATGLYASGDRPNYIDFINGFWMFETALIYRVSSLPGTQEGSLSKPFRDDVWIVASAMGVVTLLFFKLSGRMTAFSNWGFSTLSTIAAFCQQGTEPCPSRIPQRITLLTLYTATLVLYNYYTSSIVGFLLSVSPMGLKTIEQIANSPLTVVFEDVSYGRVLVQERFFTGMEELYEKKLKPKRKPNQPGVFVINKVGIELLQRGGYAYHTEPQSAYPLISKTFDQQQICELRAVKVYQKAPLYFGLPKKSPLSEMFTLGFLKAKEHGLTHRYRKLRAHERPPCSSSFVAPVSWYGVAAAFKLLGLGVATSLIILMLEYALRHLLLGLSKKKKEQEKEIVVLERRWLLNIRNKPLFPYNN